MDSNIKLYNLKTFLVSSLLLTAPVIIGGCGGGDTTETTSTEPAAGAPPTGTPTPVSTTPAPAAGGGVIAANPANPPLSFGALTFIKNKQRIERNNLSYIKFTVKPTPPDVWQVLYVEMPTEYA